MPTPATTFENALTARALALPPALEANVLAYTGNDAVFARACAIAAVVRDVRATHLPGVGGGPTLFAAAMASGKTRDEFVAYIASHVDTTQYRLSPDKANELARALTP